MTWISQFPSSPSYAHNAAARAVNLPTSPKPTSGPHRRIDIYVRSVSCQSGLLPSSPSPGRDPSMRFGVPSSPPASGNPSCCEDLLFMSVADMGPEPSVLTAPDKCSACYRAEVPLSRWCSVRPQLYKQEVAGHCLPRSLYNQSPHTPEDWADKITVAAPFLRA